MELSSAARGVFVVFEGGDKCGKTTQSRLLRERLASLRISVCSMSFPDRSTAIGGMIDSYLRSKSDMDDRAIHLLFSANRWERSVAISNALASGSFVVADRYAFSGVAFSAAKGLDSEWCMAPDRGLPAPDLVVFLDVSPAVALARRPSQDEAERYESQRFQEKVLPVFMRLTDETWKVFKADKPITELHEEIFNAVLATAAVCKQNPIARLWCSK